LDQSEIMAKPMKKVTINSAFIFSLILYACNIQTQESLSPFVDRQSITIEKSVLKDKIMGGWAGQVIGCTYGGPTEFQWNGTMIGDHVPIQWDENQMLWWYENSPGLYDDVYLNDTFIETVVMPTKENLRKHKVYWNYELPEQEYEIRLVPRDFPEGYYLVVNALVIYSKTDPGPQTYY
jgi:hypothetical protein